MNHRTSAVLQVEITDCLILTTKSITESATACIFSLRQGVE